MSERSDRQALVSVRHDCLQMTAPSLYQCCHWITVVTVSMLSLYHCCHCVADCRLLVRRSSVAETCITSRAVAGLMPCQRWSSTLASSTRCVTAWMRCCLWCTRLGSRRLRHQFASRPFFPRCIHSMALVAETELSFGYEHKLADEGTNAESGTDVLGSTVL